MPSSAADFGLFEVAVPAGYIVDVSGGEPRLAGVGIPAGAPSTDLRGVSTLVMTHPWTDEDPVPVTITVTVSPRMGGVSEHILWEDRVVGDLLPYMGDVYGGSIYWENLGSARAGSESYLREGGLEIDGIMAYRSATYTDDDMVYYVGLSAPPSCEGHVGVPAHGTCWMRSVQSRIIRNQLRAEPGICCGLCRTQFGRRSPGLMPRLGHM